MHRKSQEEHERRFGSKTTLYQGNQNGALPRDVIKVSALAGGKGLVERTSLKHPTQKPMDVTKKLLWSKIKGKQGKVLVPFAGSGSECFVAQSLKINFLGIELNKKYVNSANQWLLRGKSV